MRRQRWLLIQPRPGLPGNAADAADRRGVHDHGRDQRHPATRSRDPFRQTTAERLTQGTTPTQIAEQITHSGVRLTASRPAPAHRPE